MGVVRVELIIVDIKDPGLGICAYSWCIYIYMGPAGFLSLASVHMYHRRFYILDMCTQYIAFKGMERIHK